MRSDVLQAYDNLLDTSDHGRVGWSSHAVQHIRFDEIIRLIPESANTLIDAGCGLGDLYPYIKRSHPNLVYIGVDLNPAFIAEAQRRHTSAHFFHNDINHWSHSADVVVSSGLLATYTPSETIRLIRRLFSLAHSTLIFNLFLKEASPEQLTSTASDILRTISAPSADVIIGYTPHDMTIRLTHA